MIEPFAFVILALAAFRIQRIFTTDSWYLTQGFRRYLDRRAAPAQKANQQNFWTEIAELFSCPWCFGFWTSIAVIAEFTFLSVVPLWVYTGFAISAVVGMLGTYDER
jgi:hypothetical protein